MKNEVVTLSKSSLLPLSEAMRKGELAKFLKILNQFVECHGMSHFSVLSGLDRSNLYTILSGKGNPRLGTIHTILDTLGLELSIQPKKGKAQPKKKK